MRRPGKATDASGNHRRRRGRTGCRLPSDQGRALRGGLRTSSVPGRPGVHLRRFRRPVGAGISSPIRQRHRDHRADPRTGLGRQTGLAGVQCRLLPRRQDLGLRQSHGPPTIQAVANSRPDQGWPLDPAPSEDQILQQVRERNGQRLAVPAHGAKGLSGYLGAAAPGEIRGVLRQDRHDLDLEQSNLAGGVQERGRTGGAPGLPHGQLRRGDRCSGRAGRSTGRRGPYLGRGNPDRGIRGLGHRDGRAVRGRRKRTAGIRRHHRHHPVLRVHTPGAAPAQGVPGQAGGRRLPVGGADGAGHGPAVHQQVLAQHRGPRHALRGLDRTHQPDRP